MALDYEERYTHTGVVTNFVQNVPVLIGPQRTELNDDVVIKASDNHRSVSEQPDFCAINLINVSAHILLQPKYGICAPTENLVNVGVTHVGNYRGDLLVETSFRFAERQNFCVPRTMFRVNYVPSRKPRQNSRACNQYIYGSNEA